MDPGTSVFTQNSPSTSKAIDKIQTATSNLSLSDKNKNRRRTRKKEEKLLTPRKSIPKSIIFTPSSQEKLIVTPNSLRNGYRIPPRLRTNSEKVDTIFTFTIKAVATSKYGKFIKKRNTNLKKRIKLKTFVRKSYPCVFTSKHYEINLNKLKDLNVTPKKEGTKQRKYDLSKKDQRKRNSSSRSQEVYEPYITKDEVEIGLKNGSLIKGILRINPKNPKTAFVSNENTFSPDYVINGVGARNKSLDGDEVVIQVLPKTEASEGKNMPAKVVFISQHIHPRTSVGSISLPERVRNPDYALFTPRDVRLPFQKIPPVCWPMGFKKEPKKFRENLYIAKIMRWDNPSVAHGVITESLGISNNLRVEQIAILKEFLLDTTGYGPEMMKYFPESKEIPEKEFEYRQDLRKECIFTIDPPTAKDLDDACSVKELTNGNYEIGVHISDASFYLAENTELDQKVAQKATTIYMVDKAYHMLPLELCLFCSLLPGTDKLAFSVFWEITPEAEILNTRFTRTIVNSCVQLAYDHAQQMIEDPEKQFSVNDLPKIMNGFTSADLSKRVNILQKLALKLRQKRMENGALRINQVKLSYTLDPHDGEPVDYFVYEIKDAHRMIEEFMLLANISVANKIYDHFPNLAFLRRHEPPKGTMMEELRTTLETCGLHIDVSSSKGISECLQKYITSDFAGQCRGAVLNHLLAKPMARAKYFCAGSVETEYQFSHFALSCPIYTHFTSPIRRYADIMVHRLLAASLEYTEAPSWDKDRVISIAANCNAQKYNEKRAGESCRELYLAHYIEKNQPFIEDAVVVDVKQRFLDVIVLKTGSIVRMYPKSAGEGSVWTSAKLKNEENSKKDSEKGLWRVTLTFPKTKDLGETNLILEMFTIIKVALLRKKNNYKLDGLFMRPVK